MKNVLDNPIYHSLRSGHQEFAKGNEDAWYYEEDVSVFAGLASNNAREFEELNRIGPESTLVVFSPVALSIPDNLRQTGRIDMFQMVYGSIDIPAEKNEQLTELKEEHVREMAALIELTKPGPFRSRTIEFGNYIGVFEAGKLVAMAGFRFNPVPYMEISAVCTHPDHLGKGYAYKLMRELVKRILAKRQTPFLHVRRDNEGAIRLYEKLGFVTRSEMMAYIIRKA